MRDSALNPSPSSNLKSRITPVVVPKKLGFGIRVE